MKKNILLPTCVTGLEFLNKINIDSYIKHTNIQGAPKKNASKEGHVWFFHPKNVTVGSGVDQNKKSSSFWPIGQKMLILLENFEFSMASNNFPLKKGIFWPMDQKANGNIFRVKKWHMSLRSVFVGAPCNWFSHLGFYLFNKFEKEIWQKHSRNYWKELSLYNEQ